MIVNSRRLALWGVGRARISRKQTWHTTFQCPWDNCPNSRSDGRRLFCTYFTYEERLLGRLQGGRLPQGAHPHPPSICAGIYPRVAGLEDQQTVEWHLILG